MQVTVSLIGFEKHKARPDLGSESGFWLRVNAADALPFVAAFKASPEMFHEFLIEERVGKQTRASKLTARIIEIQEGSEEARIQILPDPEYGAALY